MALPAGSEVLWCGGVGRLVNLFPPLAAAAGGLLDPIKTSPGVAVQQEEPVEPQRGLCGFPAPHPSPPGLGSLLMETPLLDLAAGPQETGWAARCHFQALGGGDGETGREPVPLRTIFHK